MRKRISTNTRKTRFLWVGLGFGALIVSIYFLMEPQIDYEKVVISWGFAFVFAILYYYTDSSKSVDYDNEFMYIVGKDEEVKIPLKDIYEIQRSGRNRNNRVGWKVRYYNSQRKKQSVHIMPYFKESSFEEFKDKMRQVNKNFLIHNWANPFDF